MTGPDQPSSIVEVRPEVMFLSEVLDELTRGRIRIPRFQRPFVWRRDQMTDLLDSVYNQYPIGSLLVWETDIHVATLDRLGPFRFMTDDSRASGYLLDGHQRLSTLAGALVPHEDAVRDPDDQDPGRWDLAWNMVTGRFQHGRAEDDPANLFPLTSLLDTLRFFDSIDKARRAFESSSRKVEAYIQGVSQLARSFQHYRVSVIRIHKTGLTEAVEIFARLNSKGQSMSADQMVSALMYRQRGGQPAFDLATEIDGIVESLGERNFGDIDRTAILRAILANLDEDIYRTDWTRLAGTRREELAKRLSIGVKRAYVSLDIAVSFLQALGVKIIRLLPYAMQLVVLSAFFDQEPEPSPTQLELLTRWFWVSSFSGWFGGANPSRVNALVAEFRTIARDRHPVELANFDLNARALPYPSTFDMRSARTRALLLVMLSLGPKMPNGDEIAEPWVEIAEKGPSAVGHIIGEAPRAFAGNPANRMIRPPNAARGILRGWLESNLWDATNEVLLSHGLDRQMLVLLANRQEGAFLERRQSLLVSIERYFLDQVHVRKSAAMLGDAPVDTD